MIHRWFLLATLLALLSRAAIDGLGRILVANVRAFSDRIAVFDSAGSFLRMVGRRGQGPSEFQAIKEIVAGPEFIGRNGPEATPSSCSPFGGPSATETRFG